MGDAGNASGREGYQCKCREEMGVGRRNEAGRDLIDCCGEHGLEYVNNLMTHAKWGM